jgi:glycosyltransferase involved in cell wall biosynthesis
VPPTVAVDLRALVPAPTGIGVSTRELLASLGPSGAFRYRGFAHRPVHDEAILAAAGVPVEVVPAPLGVTWQQWQLPGRLRRGDCDLLWSPLQTLPLRGEVPGVVTVHDLTVLLFPDFHTLKVRYSQVPFLARSLEKARRVIAVSNATADDLRRHFPAAFVGRPEKLRVIHGGVRPEFTPGEPAAIAALRAELGCPEGYLLYAGTLEPRKNIGTLVSAWAALRREFPTTLPLVLAGGYGWRSRGLERQLAELAPAGLRHLGRVTDARLLELLQAASVFVYPSFYEGFGLPVVEAMACGVPVVTSDRSSLPEVAGGAALLVDPEDAGQLAGAVAHLLAEPALAAELAGRGLERARTFRWDSAARAHEEAFVEALSEEPRD